METRTMGMLLARRMRLSSLVRRMEWIQLGG